MEPDKRHISPYELFRQKSYLLLLCVALLGVPAIACNGTTLNSYEGKNQPILPESNSLRGCTLSEPGDTVIGIAVEFGGNFRSPVTVDKRNDGDIDYKGPAVNGPPLDYNIGPQGNTGPIWDNPIQDKVCVFK